MSHAACTDALPTADLVDYSLGELDTAREEAVEEHLFGCEACSRALDAIVSIGAGIFSTIAEGRARVAATGALLDRAAARGATIRHYRLRPGETVACTAAPDDTYVAVRLAGVHEGLAEMALQVEFEDLGSGERGVRRIDGMPVDAATGELVLLLPGGLVRAYPRSRWIMRASATHGATAVELGPYTLDHTPWEDLPHR